MVNEALHHAYIGNLAFVVCKSALHSKCESLLGLWTYTASTSENDTCGMQGGNSVMLCEYACAVSPTLKGGLSGMGLK